MMSYSNMVWPTQYSSLTVLNDVLQVRITQFMTCVCIVVYESISFTDKRF